MGEITRGDCVDGGRERQGSPLPVSSLDVEAKRGGGGEELRMEGGVIPLTEMTGTAMTYDKEGPQL